MRTTTSVALLLGVLAIICGSALKDENNDANANASKTKEEVSQAAAIEKGKRLSKKVEDPGYSQKEKMVIASRFLADMGHGGTLAFQITCRDDDEDGKVRMWTSKYGRLLEELVIDDFILIDENLDTVKGSGHPNLASRFHLHVYRNRSDFKCMIHTHPKNVNALVMIGQPLQVQHMDVMVFYEDVAQLDRWPGVPFGDWEGELIAETLHPDFNAAILANHGMIVGGTTIEQATYRAFFIEKAAEMQLMALQTGLPIVEVDRDLGVAARNWRRNLGPVNAHFLAWARQTLKKNGNIFYRH
mmetsp:Transcript_31041/g.54495  ORF Transcript_31041/g.54495 Transcript_31041/m.54495 type:complete len:300 (-) Transcript_31041:207-1106(-)